MSRSARASAIAVVAIALGLANAASACTGDDDDTTPTAADPQPPNDTGPTTTTLRDSEFCTGMIDLSQRLEEADETDDTAAMIRSAYADLDPVVPLVIRPDFDAVRELLVAEADGKSTTTTDAAVATSSPSDVTAAAGDGEGTSVADTPSERLAAYVDFACRGIANNPGPPATQPP